MISMVEVFQLPDRSADLTDMLWKPSLMPGKTCCHSTFRLMVTHSSSGIISLRPSKITMPEPISNRKPSASTSAVFTRVSSWGLAMMTSGMNMSLRVSRNGFGKM